MAECRHGGQAHATEEHGAIVTDPEGDITAGIEAEHDARVTQRLILQPRAEVNFALQDIPELSVGSGLVSASLGARLRYEITPLLALTSASSTSAPLGAPAQ